MQPFSTGCPHDGQRLREVFRSCWVQQEFAHGLQAQQRGAVRLQPLGEWALTLHRQLRASSPVPCAPSPEPAPQGLLWHLLLSKIPVFSHHAACWTHCLALEAAVQWASSMYMTIIYWIIYRAMKSIDLTHVSVLEIFWFLQREVPS